MTLTAEFIRRTRDQDFKVIAGRDILILGTLVYGGAGTVASSANVVPELVVEIYDKFMDGDLTGALEAQYRLAPMRMAYNLGSFPVVTKDYMRLLGFEVGESIRPNTRSNPDNMLKLKKLLDDLGAERLA
jgi:4-hydroxy-tetrahydrodipicolinate synthase